MKLSASFACGSILLALMAGSPLSAGPIVTFTANPAPAPAGFFRYDMTVINPNQNPQKFITGLIVSSAFSLFGVDASSTIGAPRVNGNQWGFVAPAPPFADNLTYFSPAAAGDIGPGGVQGGFRFDSPVSFDSICPCDFEVVLIERTAGPLPPINPTLVPEPATAAVAGLSMLAFLGFARRRRNRT